MFPGAEIKSTNSSICCYSGLCNCTFLRRFSAAWRKFDSGVSSCAGKPGCQCRRCAGRLFADADDPGGTPVCCGPAHQAGPARQAEHAISMAVSPNKKGRGISTSPGLRDCICGRPQIISIATATASPPPMHRLAIPRLPPVFFKAPIRVARMRAPLAPIGWPSAQAPPWILTLSCGRP